MAAINFSIPPGQGVPYPSLSTSPGQGLLFLPVPAITTLTPNTAVHGAAAINLVIAGTNFQSAAAVTFGGAAVVSNPGTDTQISVPISATLLATAATKPVVVTNPDAQASASSNFTIT